MHCWDIDLCPLPTVAATMDPLGTTSVVPKCTFRSGEGTKSGRSMSACMTDAPVTKNLLVGCHRCCSGKTTWRCICCYKKFVDCIKHTFSKLPKTSKPLFSDAIAFMLSTDWKQVTESRHPPFLQASKHIVGHLEWIAGCPCCSNFQLPPVPRLDIYIGLKRLPKLEVQTLTEDWLEYNPDVDGMSPVSLHVEVVTAYPIRSKEEELHFKYHTIPEECHAAIFHSPPVPPGKNLRVWRIVRYGEPPFDCLSAVQFHEFGQFTLDDLDQFGRACRSVAPLRTLPHGGVLASNTVGGFSFSSLRTNRTGGPNGNANGVNTKALKQLVCDPCVVGATPCREESTILVPVADKNGLVTSAVPFYPAITSKTGNVTHPKHTAIPRRGSVAQGLDLLLSIKDDNRLRRIFQMFAAVRMSAAILMVLLHKHGLESSLFEAMETIERFEEAEARVKRGEKDCGNQKSSRKPNVATEEEIRVGSYVFYPECGSDLPGVVNKKYCAGKSTLLRITPVGGGKDVIHTVENVQGYCQYGRFSDDDDTSKKRKRISWKEKRDMFKSGFTLLEIMGIIAAYTTCFDVTYGHFDFFGEDALDSLFENKMVVPLGDPDESVSLPACGTFGVVPPGALCFPRVGVGTILSTEHVELHVLNNFLHLGPGTAKISLKTKAAGKPRAKSRRARQRQATQRKMQERLTAVTPRGCWHNDSFYPKGYAILDWNSRLTGFSYTAVQLREAARRAGGTVYRDYRHRVFVARAEAREAEAQRDRATNAT